LSDLEQAVDAACSFLFYLTLTLYANRNRSSWVMNVQSWMFRNIFIIHDFVCCK